MTAKIHMRPPSRASLCSGNWTEQTVTSCRARSQPGVTDEHRQWRVSCPGCSQVLQELHLHWPESSSPPGADAHSRWMIYVPNCLHQTWPMLIINDSGGQCPIFTAESSVMPGRAKPPEFHHFQVLFTLKKQKRSPQLFNNGYLGGRKNSWNVFTKWGTIYLFFGLKFDGWFALIINPTWPFSSNHQSDLFFFFYHFSKSCLSLLLVNILLHAFYIQFHVLSV